MIDFGRSTNRRAWIQIVGDSESDAGHPFRLVGAISERRPSMARAGAASASVRSDSIQGLAQSIAKPAYRRLLTAEPFLSRAVSGLVNAFLPTICVWGALTGAR